MTLGAAHWKEDAMAGVTTRLLRASALVPGTTPQPVVISHRAGLIRYTYCMHKGSLSLMLYAQRFTRSDAVCSKVHSICSTGLHFKPLADESPCLRSLLALSLT